MQALPQVSYLQGSVHSGVFFLNSTFCLACSLHKQWIFDGFSCLRLMISGLLESVLGENLACFNRFYHNKSSSSWIGGLGYADFSLQELTCWRSHPSEADLQAFKRYEQNWRLFFKAYIGVDFYETKPTFCAIFHVWPLSDSHNFFLPFFFLFQFNPPWFLEGPRIWKGLETMGSNLRTLGTACSSCTAISACGLQEFGLRLSWLPCESLGERFVGWFFHVFYGKS